MDVTVKDDDSPVTEADLAAHNIICPALEQLLPGVPVLSEESEIPPFDERALWHRYWIVDPLDGTREFIRRNGEFTVNIALIEQGVPVLGVVYVPVSGVSYAGLQGVGAFKYEGDNKTAISVRTMAQREREGNPVMVVASRSHGAEAVKPHAEQDCRLAGCGGNPQYGQLIKALPCGRGDSRYLPSPCADL